MNSLNELTSVSRSGNFTVAGGAQGNPSSVTVNSVAASLYADKNGGASPDSLYTESYARFAKRCHLGIRRWNQE